MREDAPMRERDADDTAALLAIQRLQGAYGDAVTRRAWDEVRALFEADATVHITTHTRDPFVLEGPDGVVDFVERSLEQFAAFVFTIENAVAEVDGDDGTGRVYICELRHHVDGPWTQAHGLYRDRYRRRDGVWRIAARHYSSLIRVGATVESFPMPR
jgi:hypothetical protein